MKRENRLLSIAFCASAMLHAGLVLFLTVNSKGLAGTPGLAGAPGRDAGVFALVNINVPEEPAPATPLPELQPVPAEPPPEPEIENGPAEIFIVAEAIPPEAEEPAVPAELPAGFSGEAGAAMAGAPREAGRGGPETGAVPAEAYVRRNFVYIQRRIRDRLRYPSQARRAGIQGTVEIGFTVHRDGAVSAVAVLMSSGQESLDQAAMAAVFAAAPFPPPPAQARLVIPVAFRLR
jgi:protein TonB